MADPFVPTYYGSSTVIAQQPHQSTTQPRPARWGRRQRGFLYPVRVGFAPIGSSGSGYGSGYGDPVLLGGSDPLVPSVSAPIAVGV